MHWGIGEHVEGDDDATIFAIPVVSGGVLRLCWNASSTLDSAASQADGTTASSADFSFAVGTVHFMPLPILTGKTPLALRICGCGLPALAVECFIWRACILQF